MFKKIGIIGFGHVGGAVVKSLKKYASLISGGLTPIRRWGVPEDVAKAVVAIVSDSFPFSTGECINVDGGFHIRSI